MQPNTVSLTISRDEALVLFDWLASLGNEPNEVELDPPVQQTLWRIEGQLESALVEVLEPDYSEKLRLARQRLSSDSPST